MKKTVLGGLFFAALAAAFAVRLASLSLRPMHHDEANQAVKFGALLEHGEYRYDKSDHHGPTLYYLTLPFAKARNQFKLADVDEATLRAVPAVFGAGLLLLLLLAGPGLAREARLIAALLIAASPVMTYYSRFYIQESIFAFFSLGFLVSLWRYLRQPNSGWAAAAGIFAGLMAATKETAVVVYFAALLAAAAVMIRQRRRARRVKNIVRPRIYFRDIVFAAAAAAGTAALFYSSFGTHPAGIVDALSALKTFAVKGVSAPGLHAHPPFFYLGLLAFTKSGGLVWSEAFVLLLGLAGMAFIIPKKASEIMREDRSLIDESFGLFLVVYTIASTLVFSLLAYKTPWNILPFYLGWLVLAGIGGAAILESVKPPILKTVVLLALAAGLAHLGLQNHRANFLYPSDPRNPYVYAQTGSDFPKLVRRVEDLAALHPAKSELIIKVVAGPYEQWPLPWSLRGFKNVGYWADAASAGDFARVDLVIAAGDQTEIIKGRLGERFVFEYFGLRPDVLLALFIPRDAWNRFLKSRGERT